MNIDRFKLLCICRETLHKMEKRKSSIDNRSWKDVLDMEFIDYLLECVIMHNPTENCIRLGDTNEWDALPKEKSLFFSGDGRGLPIGNLSSQLFSNIYLNKLDQFVKRTLKCKHYGRYVDDAYIVSDSKERLKSIVLPISKFMESELGLKIHSYKTRIFDVRHGVEFLGAYIRPFRIYISSSSLSRTKRRILSLYKSSDNIEPSVNSYLGVFSHYDSYCIRRVLFGYNSKLNTVGCFDKNWLKFRQNFC